MIKNVGIIPTILIIRSFFNLLIQRSNNGLNIISLETLLLRITNPSFRLIFRTFVLDNLKFFNELDILSILKLRNIIFFIILLFCVKPFFKKLVNLILFTLASSLGITFNSFLYGFSILKNVSDYMLDFFGLNSIKLYFNNKDNLDSMSYWYLISIILGGISSIFIIVLLIDKYSPDSLTGIPYLNNILDSFYNICNSSWSWIKSLNPWRVEHITPMTTPSDHTITLSPRSPLNTLDLNPDVNIFSKTLPNPFE
jgi:hypothetical protein